MSNATPKRVMIACGGTGGHLAPGIALAQRLTERGHACRLFISSKQVDSRLSQKYPTLTFDSLPAVAWGRTPISAAKFVWSQLTSLATCLKIMQQFKPQVIVGFGGFLTVSAGICASLTGKPLYLHESNHRVGRTIRMLSRLAHTVYVPTGIEPMPRLKSKNIVELGMPLRNDLIKISREDARKALGLPLRGRLLVIMGGSQGSSSLNQWATDHEQTLLEAGVHLYCVTGLGKTAARTHEIALPLGQLARSVFVPFSDEMHLLYAAADLVIARAGAGTIAELVYFNTPSILIPFPYAADDHQRANANHLERLGGAVVIDETQLDNLLAEVLYTLKSETLLESLQENLARIDAGDPASFIADTIEQIKSSHHPFPSPAIAPISLEQRFEDTLRKLLGEDHTVKLLLNESLGAKTTFGIGGPARFYAEPASEAELKALLRTAHTCGVPTFCLGRGSNILVLDKGFDGLVIRLNHPTWQKIDFLPGKRLRAGAGVRLKTLCGETCRLGLEGFEFMEGIPATVGGALRMNAGAMGGWFFERVESIRLIDSAGRILNKSAEDFTASYRQVSSLEGTIVLSVVLTPLKESPTEAIRLAMEANQAKRHAAQPREASAGCVFRNPPHQHAGRLIDQAGLKGLRVGDAAVSPTHANFIVNLGSASASDVIALINEIRTKVYAAQKIILEPEIMLLGGRWNDYLLPLES